MRQHLALVIVLLLTTRSASSVRMWECMQNQCATQKSSCLADAACQLVYPKFLYCQSHDAQCIASQTTADIHSCFSLCSAQSSNALLTAYATCLSDCDSSAASRIGAALVACVALLALLAV